MGVKEMARTPGLEKLLQQALAEKDPGRLNMLLCQMDKLAYDDAILIPFFSDAMIGAIDPSFQDAILFVSGATLYDLTKAWMKKK